MCQLSNPNGLRTARVMVLDEDLKHEPQVDQERLPKKTLTKWWGDREHA
jgi:hypothetical protein